MKLAQKELGTFKHNIAGMFRFAEEQGLDAVQIHLPDEERLVQIKSAIKETGVQVASVNAMSCAMLGPDKTAQEHEHRQVKKALHIAEELSAPTVTNFAGFDYTKTMDENAVEFARVYECHAREAERRGLKICFENCPMFGGMPFRAQNMAYCPAHWQLIFEACDSTALGLEFDTSHTVYLALDTAALLRQWKNRIYHIQIKDCKLDRQRQQDIGVAAGIPHSLVPLGEGDLQAEEVFNAIQEIGFAGYVTSDIEGDQMDAAKRNIRAMKNALAQLV